MTAAGGANVAECVRRQLDEVEAMRAVFGEERVVVHPTEGAALLESWLSALRPTSAIPTSGASRSDDGPPWPAAAISECTTVADSGHRAAAISSLSLDRRKSSSECPVVAVVTATKVEGGGS